MAWSGAAASKPGSSRRPPAGESAGDREPPADRRWTGGAPPGGAAADDRGARVGHRRRGPAPGAHTIDLGMSERTALVGRRGCACVRKVGCARVRSLARPVVRADGRPSRARAAGGVALARGPRCGEHVSRGGDARWPRTRVDARAGALCSPVRVLARFPANESRSGRRTPRPSAPVDQRSSAASTSVPAPC